MAALGERKFSSTVGDAGASGGRGTLNPQYNGTTNPQYDNAFAQYNGDAAGGSPAHAAGNPEDTGTTNAQYDNSSDRNSARAVVTQVTNPMYAISLPSSVSGAVYVGGSLNTAPHTARSLKSKGFVRGGTARASTYSTPVMQPNNTVKVTADDGPVYTIPMDVEYLQVGATATSNRC